MIPVQKAIWYIETHFAHAVALDDIARVSGVTRYHLVRAFGFATGCPVMRYVRGRRLTEAARALANGAPGILAVAIDAGYGSHEAFTRAFCDQFGGAPETVRARGSTDQLTLTEPIKMDETLLENLEPPRIEDGRAMVIAGLAARYDNDTSAGIPAQWQRFAPHLGHIAGQVGCTTYGVCSDSDSEGNITYLSGVEVSDTSDLPREFSRIKLAKQRYAVFTHREHISAIRRTWRTIYNKWLPESGIELAAAPDFERYCEDFDPETGMGGVEIWIPIKA